MQKWLILKAERKGPFLNSPTVWKQAGTIEDDSPESAVLRSCFVVGSSEVKIMPIYEAHQENEWG